MPVPEVLPWLAMRAGRPLSPTGLRSGGPDLVEMVTKPLKDHKRLLLWDVDGIDREKPRLEFYRRFEGKGLWVDGGIRNLDGVIDVLVAGAEVAVLDMATFPSLEDLEAAGELTDKLAVCVREGETSGRERRLLNLRPIDIFREALRSGISRGVYLHSSSLRQVPEWVHSLEEMELFVGPAKPPGAGDESRPRRFVVDAYELI